MKTGGVGKVEGSWEEKLLLELHGLKLELVFGVVVVPVNLAMAV